MYYFADGIYHIPGNTNSIVELPENSVLQCTTILGDLYFPVSRHAEYFLSPLCYRALR